MTTPGALINRALRPLGLKLARTSQRPYAAQHEAVVRELTGAFTHYIAPDLPDAPDRTGLMLAFEGTGVTEGLYIAARLHATRALPGDVCEFGVAGGACSAFIANEIRSSDKHLWLFDSFEGLPAPSPQDVLIHDIHNRGSMAAYQGDMAYPQARVLARLAAVAFPAARTHIVPGFIEQTITRPDMPAQVSFAYVDFDFYEPILTALRFLAERMPPGGVVIVDDYGYFSAGAQTAVDEFVAAQGGRFTLELPPAWAGAFAVLTLRAGEG
jgi:hypothetical protein